MLALRTNRTLPHPVPFSAETLLLSLWPARHYDARLSVPPVGKLNGGCTTARPAQHHDPVASQKSAAPRDTRMHVPVQIFGETFFALIDTGAIRSYISDKIYDLCNRHGHTGNTVTSSHAQLADSSIITVTKSFMLRLVVADQVITESLFHLPKLSSDVVFGMDILREYFALDLVTDTVSVRHRPTPKRGTNQIEPLGEIAETLSSQEESRLAAFLEEELPSFRDIRGNTSLVEHRIRLCQKNPIKQRYRPQNPRRQAIIDQEVDEMLQNGIIEASDSPWSSPVVIVHKKDGKPRFCIDFRKVNEVSQKDAYPLPYINAILDKLRKARYISSIDLKQGYWQIPLSADSKPITAFTVPSRGLFQFRVMPFGLHSAPATFQRLLDRIIGPEMDPYAFAYLDDIIVLGETFEEHLHHLREVFRRLRLANLQLNPDKCQFCRKTLKYLGHVVTAEGITTDPEKVESIRQIPTPRNVRDVRRFLGVASWYRRFVPSFSQIASPLTKLLKKHNRFKWTEEQTTAFDRLKTCLTEAPVLACPDFEKPFTLQTDASDLGLGVALTQNLQGGDHIIAYASRTLTPAERNFSVTERECLAIVWGVEKMRPYLEGYRFTVLTDHQSLRWLHSIKSPTGRLARWSIFLQQYDFEIKYRKGALNRVADALSRQPLPGSTSDPDTQELCIVEDAPDCAWYQRKKAEVENTPESVPDYCIRDNRLFRHFWDSSDYTEPDLTDPWKLCVPKTLRKTVLEENHDAPHAGHMGIAKTIARISLRYYWPGMFRDIAKYVRSCVTCQRYKPLQQQPAGKMQPSVNRHPWETVSTDLVGPLPRSAKGNNFIVVFQDRFTKWIQCRAIRSATARNVTRALHEEVITRFGCPRRVISDNGTQYTSSLFRSLLEEFGIEHRYTPPYTPQANPVERANRTLKTMIAQYCETDHRKWDQYLSDFQLAVNSSRHESTGFSPAFLNFGRELHLPNSLYQQDTAVPEAPEDNRISPSHTDRFTRLTEIYQLVRVNLARAFSTQSHHYNLRRRDWQCHLGDLVMKRENPLSSAPKNFAAKLAPKFSGPYTVCRILSPVVYDLKDASGRKLNRIHIKDLKPFINSVTSAEENPDQGETGRRATTRCPGPRNSSSSPRWRTSEEVAGDPPELCPKESPDPPQIDPGSQREISRANERDLAALHVTD